MTDKKEQTVREKQIKDEKNLSFLLLAESQRKMDVSSCKSAEELLAKVFSAVNNRISDEELDDIAAAGGIYVKRLERIKWN